MRWRNKLAVKHFFSQKLTFHNKIVFFFHLFRCILTDARLGNPIVWTLSVSMKFQWFFSFASNNWMCLLLLTKDSRIFDTEIFFFYQICDEIIIIFFNSISCIALYYRIFDHVATQLIKVVGKNLFIFLSPLVYWKFHQNWRLHVKSECGKALAAVEW